MERIILSKNDLLNYEKQMRMMKHLDRYYLTRQFCYGNVLDISCGCGYGSHIISTNPTVTKVVGVDIDNESIKYANYQYKSDKVSFITSSIEDFEPIKADVLVSIETIEHIDNPEIMNYIAVNSEVKDLIISYPTKVSTNYNPYHKFDFVRGDIEKIFESFKIVNRIELGLEVEILIMTKDHSGINQLRRHYR